MSRIDMDDRTLLGRQQPAPRRPARSGTGWCLGKVALLNLALTGTLLFVLGMLAGRVIEVLV